jgi:hypothetical protein
MERRKRKERKSETTSLAKDTVTMLICLRETQTQRGRRSTAKRRFGRRCEVVFSFAKQSLFSTLLISGSLFEMLNQVQHDGVVTVSP